MGCPQGKSQCWGNSASCAGAGKSCFSGNILKGCILQESHSAHTELSPCVTEGLSCPCPLQPSLYWRPPLFLDVRTWKVWNDVTKCLCPNLCEQLEQMVWSVNCWRRKQKRRVNKVLLSLTFFHGFVLHWPLKSTNLNWIWVPQRHHKWFQNQ